MVKIRFKQRLGRDLELENPVKFNDKLQWLKLNWHDPLMTKCADKYEVRDYVKDKIGNNYLNELIDVYDSANEIDITKLPDKFVLKATHGSGFNIICKDKNKINWQEEYKKIKRWLRINYYWSKREWVYKNIKPRVICEKFMEEDNLGTLKDYKIFCFNGEPKLIQVDFDVFTNHKRNYYDLNWNLLNLEIEFPSDSDYIIKKPDTLDEMLKLSKKLAEPFPFVRVDFYNVNEKIIFGELTFYHDAGFGKFNPSEYEEELGKYLVLPEKKNLNKVFYRTNILIYLEYENKLNTYNKYVQRMCEGV